MGKLPLGLRLARNIRTFEPRDFLQTRTTAVYCALFGGFSVYANYKQYERMNSIYPDYDEYASLRGGQYNEAKQQELADVVRYNNMVDNMRSELRARGA